MANTPIEDHGLIGNMHSAALVGMNGTIDWLCMPRFDSPSIFAAILDDQKGGSFEIKPDLDGSKCHQMYWPETNVLITRMSTSDGVAEIIDYMPVGLNRDREWVPELVRRIEIVRGSMTFNVCCRPAFDYARKPHKTSVYDTHCTFESEELNVHLSSTHRLRAADDCVVSSMELRRGDRAIFALYASKGKRDGFAITYEYEEKLLDTTVDYWHRWINQCTYDGRWRESVYRSALTLKLLTYEPTGAIIAAPTSSLPESIGGHRNWDYRYTWIRDAAFTLYGFMRIGFTEEAASFMEWLKERCYEREEGQHQLQIVYGIDGKRDLIEEELPHLAGYMDSRPVRIGNGAHDQLQLDIYGELMDSVYLFNKYGSPISYDLWLQLRPMINWVCDNWNKPDAGIWEIRDEHLHFVYSKLMCWVAVDRALRLADKRSFPADRQRWLACRDEIYQDILEKGWSEQRKAFVQHYDGHVLDASNLIMPLIFFMAPNDPRMIQTIEAIARAPEEGGLLAGDLVYRYNHTEVRDGLSSPEGTFTMCTFWLVEALTRAGQKDRALLKRARLLFEKALSYANHLGLYSEETGPTGEALGNFPQAFTHLALISAAYNLDRILK